MISLREAFRKYQYFVVAHRGASSDAPENTLASFNQAILSGAHFIEMDIQVTSDGVPIVFHDKGLSRTTNGIGFASKLTFRELKKLDSGVWFDEKFSGETIPSLEEALEFLSGKVLLNIELKNLGENAPVHIKNITGLLAKYQYLDKVVISSFFYEQLKVLKKINPSIPIAPIRVPKDKTLPSILKRELDCDGFVCSVEEINDEVANDAKANNLFLGVYSVDNEEDLDFVLSFGVRAIVTNYPKKILSILKTKYKANVF
jgi:glycerophosphoryl diester phosphodiesterase